VFGDDRYQLSIVVGVDGSAGSRLALRWAARMAANEGVGIDAVGIWSPITTYGFVAIPPGYAQDDAMEKTVVSTVDEVFGPDRPKDLRILIYQGDPAFCLVQRSVEAHMIVVGSRGHGGFVGVLLGSVSARVAEHAKCPVLVVHESALATEPVRSETAAAKPVPAERVAVEEVAAGS
jgi:nucleotide-binding universal stress UspA family protein